MSRLMLCVIATELIPSSSAHADDAEDKAAALVEKLGGIVTRDETRPGKPVVSVSPKRGHRRRPPSTRSAPEPHGTPRVRNHQRRPQGTATIPEPHHPRPDRYAHHPMMACQNWPG